MKKSRRTLEIEARRAADPIAQAVGRDDIDYSSDDLPVAPRSIDQISNAELRRIGDSILGKCPHCQKPVGLSDGECTGWHPEFKCECGFEAGSHATEWQFCPMCGKVRPTEIFNDGIIQGRV